MWYFSSFKITTWRKGFVWFLRLCTVTYFRSVYLVYVFVPCTEPKFSISQIHLSPSGCHTSTTVTILPSLTFISSKVLWIIITSLFYIYIVVIWWNYKSHFLKHFKARIHHGKLNTLFKSFWAQSTHTQYSTSPLDQILLIFGLLSDSWQKCGQSLPVLGHLTERSSDSSRDPPRDKPARCTAQGDGHISGATADEDHRLYVSTAASVTVPIKCRRLDIQQPQFVWLMSPSAGHFAGQLGQERPNILE